MFKHILRVAAITAIGIAAAVGADMIWPERNDDDEMEAIGEGEDVVDVTPEQ